MVLYFFFFFFLDFKKDFHLTFNVQQQHFLFALSFAAFFVINFVEFFANFCVAIFFSILENLLCVDD